MDKANSPGRPLVKRRYMAAMVLGTALAALPSASLSADTQRAAPQTLNDLGRYCSVCWRNAHIPTDDWNDCTQAVFCRLLERLPQDTWSKALTYEGEERREFLRAIDAIKKRNQRSRRGLANGVDELADRRQTREHGIADKRAMVSEVAGTVLSNRQQRILSYSFDGWTVNEIASELRTRPERVSDEKYKAIQKLRERLVEA
jgi:RNA polymerase sigma factor (sigma-70 family)